MLSNYNDKYCDPYGFSSEDIGVSRQGEILKIIYVSDPMSSWSYGMSEEINKLKKHFEAQNPKMRFTITVGGMVPGGGEAWNYKFKETLKKHWNLVQDKTGKPFSLDLLDKPNFDFDTEPACRAVVAARQLDAKKELRFFNAIQQKFFSESKDPKDADFYESICLDLGLNYKQFLELFISKEIKELTHSEFVMNREWGVTTYPTVILQKEDNLYAIAKGYTSFESLKKQIEKIEQMAVD